MIENLLQFYYFLTGRDGSDNDVEILKSTFENMKFLFFEKKYHSDLTQEKIQNLVIRFAKHPMVISRVVIIMSHGNATELFDVDHKGYNFNKVIRNPFSSNNNPHLKDSLKLVVIQACR